MLRCRVGSDRPRRLALPDSQNILGTFVIESCNGHIFFLSVNSLISKWYKMAQFDKEANVGHDPSLHGHCGKEQSLGNRT